MGDQNEEQNATTKKVVTVEQLLEKLGGFSWFQLWAAVVTISPEISAAMISLSPILTGSHQFCENATSSSIACDKTPSFPGVLKSVVQEWNLVGSKTWISDLFTSVQMFGALFGALVAGNCAERYGRKKAHFTLCVLMGTFGFASGWAPDPYMYCLFRFVTGFAVGGCYVVYLNYLMEFLTPQYRTVCGCVSLWAVGEMLLALVGYYMPGWRQINWITSLPVFTILLAYPWMPESPRWLLCQGRTEEAMEVFDQIARWNNKPSLDPSDIKILQHQILQNGESEDSGNKKGLYGFASSMCRTFEIFKYQEYRSQLLVLMFSWFAFQLVYYGISFNMKNLSGDPYLNLLIMGVVGLPGSFSGLLFNNRLGRKTTIIGFVTVSFCLLIALITIEETNLSQQYPILILSLCLSVRLCVAAAFAVLSCFTAESFPTVVRVSSMGICALFGNVGGILAPQFVFISTSNSIYKHFLSIIT
ncbi:unnamed protein product [Orchesella dallaii]|uniref:Major facilitator superfamily (MFS) profile domain-containing protein n=1 Tax=Orchesella dallaii TaxID=48710 RepID=A0ABP1QLA3_9HEXA